MSVNGNLIDTNLRDLITNQLGSSEAKPILELMNTYMLQNNVVNAPPLMGDGQTKGDWRINLTMPDGQKQDIRPDNALSYTIIREMLKSGPIRFALEMKRAQMVSVFRNRRSVSAYSKNEELQQVTEFVIEHVLPFAAFEFTWSALVYGSAFMEQVWETKTLSQLGLDGSKYYTVPLELNLVPHETIKHIKRTNSGNFDGFIQMADYKLGTYYIISTPNVGAFAPGDVDVSVQDALVIPYNGFSRNLWGESFLYPLYPLWFWYEIIIRCLVRYSELMGDPPRLGKAPSRKKVRLSPTSSDLVDAIDYLLALAVNLTKSNAVVIPSDVDEQGRPEWELGYMQTPDRSQPFVQIIELFNQMILRSALSGDRAFTQVAGAAGSNALGEVHAEATALHNEMVVSSWLHYLNKYWISNISKYNLGMDGVPVWLEVQGLDPREREFLTAIAGIAGNSSTFQEFFYMVDWESLGKMAGLPMFTKDQAEKLKEELGKQEQQQQIEQIQTQNDLNIENTVKQTEVEKELGIGQFAPPAKESPTDLEVQLEIEKLTHGQVPIFFSQDEIKNLFGEKETATPQNFFIPFRPQSKDLATAIALAYKYQTVQLFNKAHDKMGRFATTDGQGFDSEKEQSWYQQHKQAVHIGLGAAAVVGVGVAAVWLSQSKDQVYAKVNVGSSSINVIQNMSNLSKVASSLGADATKKANVVANVGIAYKAVIDTGMVKPDVRNIKISGKMGVGSGLVTFDDRSTVHLGKSGEFLGEKFDLFGSPDMEGAKNSRYILAHELVHTRKHFSSKGQYDFHKDFEEGIVDYVAYKATGVKPTYGTKIAQIYAAANLISPGKAEAKMKKWLNSPFQNMVNEIYGKVGSDYLKTIVNTDVEGMSFFEFQKRYLEYIQLANPYHDSLGRFASRQGTIQTAGQYISQNKSGIISAYIRGGVGGSFGYDKKRVQKEIERQLGVKSAEEYKKTYDQMNVGQKLLSKPAEYLARKNGLMPKIARLAVEVGPEIAFTATVGMPLYSHSSILGGLATAAIATALFGSAPTLAVVIGGLTIGAATTFIASEVVDYAGDKITRAYLNRHAPKDNYHLSFTKMTTTKKGWKVARISNTIYQTVLGLGIQVAFEGFGGFFGLPTSGVAEQLVGLEAEPGDIHELLASLEPYIVGMLMDKVISISIPYDDQLQYIPGFYVQGNILVMTSQTLPEYLAAYEKGEIPEIQHIEFGDTSVTENEQLETVQLFNPAHDNQGRFASKQGPSTSSGHSFSLLGGNLDPKRTPKPLQAQRSANQTVSAMGQTFKSGLVKGLKVKACGDWDCMKKETGISANALGAYYQGKLVLSPHGLAYSAYDNPKFFNRIVAHEATHARRRSGGGGIEFFSKNQVDLEEGATELISMGHTKYPFNKSPYIKQMRSVAAAARRGSGDNQARAWQLVSLMHYHNDTDRGLSAYRAYANSDRFNKGTDSDVEWLMGSYPTQLEADDDTFAKSEAEIYKTLRKVQKQTFPAPKEFDESELE